MENTSVLKTILAVFIACSTLWSCQDNAVNTASPQSSLNEAFPLSEDNAKIASQDVKPGSNPFRITTIRTYEKRGKESGTFLVEGLRNKKRIIALQWNYRIDKEKKEETWQVNGYRIDASGNVKKGKLTYGTGKEIDRLTHDQNFVRAFKWFFQKDQQATAYPGWIGEFSFSAGNQYQLITIDDCVSCDTPFCSC